MQLKSGLRPVGSGRRSEPSVDRTNTRTERGYLEHDARTVRLYVQETFTFRVLTPEAAVPLVYPES